MSNAFFKKLISASLVLSMLTGPGAYASMSPPVSLEEYQSSQADRQAHQAAVESFIGQDKVAQALERMGVSPADAMRRVERLNDAELAQLASDLESAPAGGIVGAIIFVFLVLLLTDILGFTKVYPFTRSIRR